MNTEIEIRVSVFPNGGVEILFEPIAEISLDCSACGRTHRTVIFPQIDQLGRCTPSGHEFPGRIHSQSVRSKKGLFRNEFECIFRLIYQYTPVVDCKYKQRVSSPIPNWGRVCFKTTCPRCGTTSLQSIQNNIVRPWTCTCSCGYKLYTEKTIYPSFKIVSPTA
jgi:hypothetical protein